MALGGILVANVIFIMLLIIFVLFILSILLFIIFTIMHLLDKEKKWKKVAQIVAGVFTILFLTPLLITHLFLSKKQYETIEYNGSKIKLQKQVIDDFFVNVGSCDIDEINYYIKKYPELLNSTDIQGYYPIGIAIKNEQLECIKYFVNKGANINEITPKSNQGTLEYIFYYGYYDKDMIDYILDQKDIAVNKGKRAMPVGQLYAKLITRDREITEDELEIFKKLLDKGLDLSRKNGSGEDTYTYINNLSDSITNVEKLKELVNKSKE